MEGCSCSHCSVDSIPLSPGKVFTSSNRKCCPACSLDGDAVQNVRPRPRQPTRTVSALCSGGLGSLVYRAMIPQQTFACDHLELRLHAGLLPSDEGSVEILPGVG